MKLKFLIFFYSIFFLISVLANNLVFIDFNYILNNSNVGSEIIKKLERINNENIRLLKEEQSELNIQNLEIEKVKNIISDEEFNKKVEILNDKLKKFNLKQDQLSKEFKNLRETEINNFIKQINPILTKYMQDNNIDIVIKKEYIYISKSELDISDIIINLINKKNN